jgi:hypothetical protein
MSRGRARGKALAATVTAAGAFLLAAGTASAASPIPVSSSTPDGPDAPASTSATCPAKTRVSAVGFTTTTNPAVGVIIHTLSPAPRGVSVAALNLSSQPGQLSGTAYCSKLPKKKKKKGAHKGVALEAKKKKKKKVTPLTVASSTTSLAGISGGSATATCPSGTTVRTGGFDLPLVGGQLEAQVSAAELIAPNQWRMSAVSNSSSTASVTAIALCGKGPAVTPATATTTFTGPIPHSAVANCPAGKTVAFGGFVVSAGDPSGVYVSGMQRISDASFQTDAMTFVPGSITSTAYCA